MIWILTLVYYVVASLILWVGFLLYANMLLTFGRLGGVSRLVGGGITYMLFAVLLVMPLLIGLSINGWRAAFNSNAWFMIYFMASYFLSVLPGGFFFNKYYLQRLRYFGYFRKKQRF